MQNSPIIETLDPEIADRLAAADTEIKQGSSVSSGVAAGLAMASVPIALAAVARTAFAQGALPQSIIDVLNFALTLEYLESTFYQNGLAAPNLIASNDLAIFQQISKHEADHVAYLKAALGSS